MAEESGKALMAQKQVGMERLKTDTFSLRPECMEGRRPALLS